MTFRRLIELVQLELVVATPDDVCPDPSMARAEMLVADGFIAKGVPAERVANVLANAPWAWDLQERLHGMAFALVEAEVLAPVSEVAA